MTGAEHVELGRILAGHLVDVDGTAATELARNAWVRLVADLANMVADYHDQAEALDFVNLCTEADEWRATIKADVVAEMRADR